MALEHFEQKLQQLSSGEEISILLGNGFSQAWDREIFHYKNLLSRASFEHRDTALKNIFNDLDTFDFEKVMLALKSTEIMFRNYNLSHRVNELQEDAELLKTGLINAISAGHPQRSSYVTTEQYQVAKPFTCLFNKIFTVNYDLLLYWTINKSEVAPLGYQHSDGFRGDTWIAREEQSLFFLHGGLHLYDDGVSIKKHRFNDNLDYSIAEQVRVHLQQGRFPLFVSEPNNEQKLLKIRMNPYLNHAYSQLSELSGTLFIHGHSMDENDYHIFRKLKESQIRNIYVGIFGDENTDANSRARANSRTFFEYHGINLEFYDASTVNIWR